MKRLIQTAFIAIAGAIFSLTTLHAQTVGILANNTTTTIATTVDDTPVATTSSIDYSMMNWRAGLLSPYLSIGTTISTINSSVVPAVPINTQPTVTNPYAASVITQTSPTLTPVASTTSAINQTATSTISSRFAPRFVSFTSITNEAINNPVTPGPGGGTTTPQFNLNTSLGGTTPFVTSVPEPTTIALCVGLLALAGYGYSRRQQKQKTVSPEMQSILQGETNESISQ